VLPFAVQIYQSPYFSAILYVEIFITGRIRPCVSCIIHLSGTILYNPIYYIKFNSIHDSVSILRDILE